MAAAYEKGDNATVNKLLDADFTWIDTDGIMWERPDVFRADLKPLVPMTADTKITEHGYAENKVVWIQDNVDNKFAAHTWVKRPGRLSPAADERDRHAPARRGAQLQSALRYTLH